VNLKKSCTIVILTYKGKHHLEHLLPTVKAAIGNYKQGDELSVLVIDNGRDEDTKSFVENNFPEFSIEFSEKNDYLFSLNVFIAKIETEYIFIMNDDIKLDKNIFSNLIPIMDADPSLFAVTCKILEWDNKYTVSSVRMGKYTPGWLYNYYLGEDESNMKYTLYPSGGGAIFRTVMFNQLGGFDDLYRPGYCEDSDLGIRAWQNGWKTIYNPKAELYHREGGTMKNYFEKNKLEQLIFRNYVLWNVKNVRYPGFILWFILLLPYRLITFSLKNKNSFKALLHAIPLLPAAYRRRRNIKVKVPDKFWLKELNKVYAKEY
jgi:GT2 family glycosyltransferase